MGKFFDQKTALSYAWVLYKNGTSTNRASVTKWDKYSKLFGAMKLKRYIMRHFRESDVERVIIFDNVTKKEIDRMVPFTPTWNDQYPKGTFSSHSNPSRVTTNSRDQSP
jgi:hypothetical protein